MPEPALFVILSDVLPGCRPRQLLLYGLAHEIGLVGAERYPAGYELRVAEHDGRHGAVAEDVGDGCDVRELVTRARCK